MQRKILALSLITLFIFFLAVGCRKFQPLDEADMNEWLSGGKQTVFDQSGGAFSSIFPSIRESLEEQHEIGDAAFEATFVRAPAPFNSGLGPVFNNVSCTSCHISDGRGKPPVLPGEPLSAMLFRVSIPGSNSHGGPNPVPGFGGQFQQRSNAGVLAEGDISIIYNMISGQFADGSPYTLRDPVYQIINPYIPLPGNLMLSARMAPPVFGLGLLEAIDESYLVSYSDENDLNGDGISGRPNYAWDAYNQKISFGRFGWKAAVPTLIQQIAGAYNEDMGITNFIMPKESSWMQSQDDHLQDDTELSDSLLWMVNIYVKTLGVPARRNADDPAVLKGKQIFLNANCGSCHRPMSVTGTNITFPEVSNQVIFPYTDLLLHDMGAGLSDNRPDFTATGNEWRTPPLWGIGLTEKVNGHNYYLHDGRAQNLLEAILWHGGEAQSSVDYFKQLSKADRDALITFLNSL